LAFAIGHRATDSGACRRPTVSRRWRVGPFWLAALFALAALPRPACAVRLDGVRAVAVSADGAYVYAAAEFADAIVVFRRSPATGDLVPVQEVRDAPGGPLLDAVDSVALSPDGRHLYAAAFVSNALDVFQRDPASGVLTFVEAQVEGREGVEGMQSPHGAIVSPDGAHVYVAGFEGDAIAVFARDPGTGALSFVEVEREGVALDAVIWLALSPDGAHLYAASARDGAVAAFARDPGTGSLTFVQALRNGVGGVVGLTGARAVLVSPDGRHVYVASGGLPGEPADHAIAGFARDPATGLLTFLDARIDGVDGVMGLFGVYAIAFAPGGATLYAASFGANALAVFGRDANTGVLDFRQVVFDGPADLGGAHAVAASPDGGHVYVAAFNEPAVTWFAPDAATGGLSQAGVVFSMPVAPVSCPAVPPPDCRQARRAKLVLDAGRLTYAWRRGAATSRADLGDPIRRDTGYALCLYDAPGETPAGKLELLAPPESLCAAARCWRPTDRGLTFTDEAGTPGRLGRLVLRPGDDGQAGLRATAVGDALVLPALPLAAPITALLTASDGTCWGTQFTSSDDVRAGRGDAGKLVAVR